MAAATALCENELPRAEALLRAHLRQHESDVAALRMLAEVAARLRRYADAQTLLEHCLELAPSFSAARHNSYRNLHAAILANLGDVTESIEVYGIGAERVPKAAQGLDEPRPLAEDSGPAGRWRARVPACDRTRCNAR